MLCSHNLLNVGLTHDYAYICVCFMSGYCQFVCLYIFSSDLYVTMRPYLRWLMRRRCLIKYDINRVLSKIFLDTESEARKQSGNTTNKARVPGTRAEPSHDQVRHKQGVASQALQQSEDWQTKSFEFSLRLVMHIENRFGREMSTNWPRLQLSCQSTHKQDGTSSTPENETISKFDFSARVSWKQSHQD